MSVLGQHSDTRARERDGGRVKWGGDLARAGLGSRAYLGGDLVLGEG
jgi:hypothetical protein